MKIGRDALGSIPVRTAMSKRYSESLTQDLNNGFARCGQRNAVSLEQRMMGISSIVILTFLTGMPSRFSKGKNRYDYSPVISRWGNGRLAEWSIAAVLKTVEL